MMDSTVQIFGDPVDAKALAQIENCMLHERAVAGALMADHHLGYSMPIGGVIAYEGAISPSGVGFDIACGNKAVKTNLAVADLVGDESWRLPQGAAGETPPDTATDISQGRELTPEGEPKNEAPTRAYSMLVAERITPIMREIQRRIEFGIGRRNATPIDHDLLDAAIWLELERLSPGLKEKAAAQLGTVGSGNHYVDLLVDESGVLWVANHFGSRGLGHTIATGFLNLAAGKEFGARGAESETPTVLPVAQELGAFYLEAMQLAGRYAYAGRDYVLDQVLSILGAESVFSVHNHHNFAWPEDGRWVVRKGATPLTAEPAFIGGSMGDVSVIVRGTGLDVGALGSAPHGAGRVMSRTKAAGKWRKERVKRIASDGSEYEKKIRVRDASTAAIDWDATRAQLGERGIVVLGAGADEAPGVYKDLSTVLAAHPNIEILERLSPVGVVMAGEDTFDPYKD